MRTSTIAVDLDLVDLSAPETFWRFDMDAVWRQLRTEHRVYRHPATASGREFWVLSRYDDVLQMYKDDATFVSTPGNMLESLHKVAGDPAAGQALVMTDGRAHTKLRTILMKAFTPRIREYVVGRLQTHVDRLVSRHVAAGVFDFAAEVADEIPLWVICDLLGFPEEDRPRLLELSRFALSAEDSDQTAEERWLIRNELLIYCSDMLEERRENPADDFLSAMIEARVDGQRLTDQEIALNSYGLLLAGDHTSRLAMIGALALFATDPDVWRRVRTGAAAPNTVVDEIIRWTSPVMHVARTAAADTDLGGQRIRAEDIVTAWNVSANHDGRAFPHPEVFDPARTPNRHLGFGQGRHYCFGTFLGKAEISALLDTLSRTVTEIEPAGEPSPLYSTFLRGYAHLPLVWR